MVANSSFGTATFAPNIDGTFIPQEPGQMLLSRKIDTSVELIIAHNLDEGLMFTDPRVDDESGFSDFVGGLIPTLGDKIISFVSELLYPEDYSDSQPYTTPTERVSFAIGEMIVSCYAFGLNLAYGGSARGYQFSIFPGMHSQDLAFTFWNGATTDSWGLPLPSTVAQKMQGWFTLYGSTGTSSVKSLPKYGFNAQVVNISLPSTFNTVSDPAANTRCGFLLAL
ncbi:hypothetical protein EDB80DRAFT_880839 [Ilyonectria destructans]|nr:hypothetical protein EDB80DRAFT_880839 [Ilyonectria destructans]